MEKLSKEQARRLMLRIQGLVGEYRFAGKEGILAFIKQAGCVQYDPIDVCGKNAELTLRTRVQGFDKKMLYELLYQQRALLDYFDKNLAILRREDWPMLERIREKYRQQTRGAEQVERVEEYVLKEVETRGPLSSKDLNLDERVDWYWQNTRLARAALETLYFRGQLVVHHKVGTIKYYDINRRHIPEALLQAPDPYAADEDAYTMWRLLRRVRAVGLLWDRPSDALLGIENLGGGRRKTLLAQMAEQGQIIPIQVEGIPDTFYLAAADRQILEQVQAGAKYRARTELIAPLDSFLWDRRLIGALFDFAYKWEIYTPVVAREYGYYVLPILRGERLIGRCEVTCVRDQQVLQVKQVWLETGVRQGKGLDQSLQAMFGKFARFHGCHYEREPIPYASRVLANR